MAIIYRTMFPAPAGMNRVTMSSNKYNDNVPRTSGDEPIRRSKPPPVWLCSPHQRG